MKYLLSLLLLCLLFVILPAAAMPVLVDHGNLADWKTEQNDGPEPQIIDLGNGNMRVWLDTSKNVRFTKSIDFTGVNQITFKLQNYEMDDFKPSGIRFAVSIDGESKLALKWNDIENGIKNGKTWEVNTKGYSGDHKLGFSFICSNKADGMGLEVHDLSIIANTAVPSPSALTLDHDAIKPGESVTA